MGSVTSKLVKSGLNLRRNTDLNGVMQAFIPVNIHKYHHPRHEKILDGYDYFNTYIVVGILRATINFRRSDVRRHVMALEAIRVVSRISCNNNNTAVLSTLCVPYL